MMAWPPVLRGAIVGRGQAEHSVHRLTSACPVGQDVWSDLSASRRLAPEVFCDLLSLVGSVFVYPLVYAGHQFQPPGEYYSSQPLS